MRTTVVAKKPYEQVRPEKSVVHAAEWAGWMEESLLHKNLLTCCSLSMSCFLFLFLLVCLWLPLLPLHHLGVLL